MKKTALLLITALLAFACTQTSETKMAEGDLTQYINPFIGTAFTGHTHPAASYPLGLIQTGPQTGNFTWEYCSGYFYEDSLIQGFTQTRLNGTGCVDLGDLLVQPFAGEKRDNLDSHFDKATEKASAGYYTVHLADNNVTAEMTAAPHVALHRYTYPKGEKANLLADFQSGLVWQNERIHTHVLESEVNFESDHVITGFTRRTEWVNRIYYYVIEFDKPIIEKELLEPQSAFEKSSRYILTFDMGDDETLNMKIGLSSASIDGAKANMAAQVSDWDFERVHNLAKAEWNKYLSRVQIEGTHDDKVNFYTSLYHLYLQPNNIADLDGQYIGPNREVTVAPNKKYYSTWSQWDTFRAAFSMYTLLTPEIIPDFVNSMLEYSEQQGHLPIWSLWGQETYTMIGNHSIPMIVAAYLNGTEGFDAERAYREIKKSITESNHHKSDWEVYDKYGYYPYDLITLESVSRTLECGFDDYCAAILAKELGKTEDYEFFMKRSNYYKNLYDTESKAMRPKDSKGEWLTPFDPYELAHADSSVGGHYTEGNALQYTWHVMQDIPGLIEVLGGKEEAGVLLDYFFNTEQGTTGTLSDVTGLIGQYAHGNEPSHHIAYIYPYLDRPEETQKLVRQITQDFYKNKPDGLIGNDDCGQMSAWYMFSALGFYPMNPVDGEFVLGAPQIPSAQINLPGGKAFTMEAVNLSQANMFVEKVELNGVEYNEKHITYKDIMNGGKLVFYMSDAPQVK